MKLGIMQPYFLPYIGYWQLMNAVDEYVIYDDVNYIKGGWINRNRILVNGEPSYLNLQLIGASPNKLIKEVLVDKDENVISKKLRQIEGAYRKAPFFETVYPMAEKIYGSKGENLSEFIKDSFDIICEYLGINTRLVFSSDLEKDNSLKGMSKVIDICKRMGADEYYNAIGGKELYPFEGFAKEGIKLSFLQTDAIDYKQYERNGFVPNLSILDAMMFCSREEIGLMLERYSLISQ